MDFGTNMPVAGKNGGWKREAIAGMEREEFKHIDQAVRDSAPRLAPDAVSRLLSRLDAAVADSPQAAEVMAFHPAMTVQPSILRRAVASAALLAAMAVIGFIYGGITTPESTPQQNSDYVDLLGSQPATGLYL